MPTQVHIDKFDFISRYGKKQKSLGMLSARHMKELNIRQKDLAEVLGLSRQVLKYKIDHDSFTRRELIELQDILHMGNDEILKGDNYV